MKISLIYGSRLGFRPGLTSCPGSTHEDAEDTAGLSSELQASADILILLAVQEFLLEIKGTRQVDLGAVALVAVRQARSGDEDTRLTALRWLRELVQLARQALLPQCAAILSSVLPAISSSAPALARVRQPAADDALQCH